MRRNLAQEVIRELLACSGKLDRSIALLQGMVDEDFFLCYREIAGRAMGLLYVDILRDLFRQHPELEPD